MHASPSRSGLLSPGRTLESHALAVQGAEPGASLRRTSLWHRILVPGLMPTQREINVGVHSANSPLQFNLSIFTENRISVPQGTPGTLPSTLGDVGGIHLP